MYVCTYVCLGIFFPQKEVQYLCSLFAICRFVFSQLEVVAFSSLGLSSWTVAEQELGSILLPAVGASISSRAVVAFLSGLGE